MYFWRIDELKRQMAVRPLNDQEVLPYVVVTAGLLSAMWFIPTVSPNLWSHVGTGLSVLFSILGTVWIFQKNGGAGGHHFLQRYVAIGWVVSIRWAAALVLVGIPYIALLFFVFPVSEGATWYETAFFATAEAALYWRIAVHVGDVATSTA